MHSLQLHLCNHTNIHDACVRFCIFKFVNMALHQLQMANAEWSAAKAYTHTYMHTYLRQTVRMCKVRSCCTVAS